MDRKRFPDRFSLSYLIIQNSLINNNVKTIDCKPMICLFKVVCPLQIHNTTACRYFFVEHLYMRVCMYASMHVVSSFGSGVPRTLVIHLKTTWINKRRSLLIVWEQVLISSLLYRGTANTLTSYYLGRQWQRNHAEF